MQTRALLEDETGGAAEPRRSAHRRASACRAAAQRVVHVVRNYGEVSEPFIVDGVYEVDRLDWESWVVAMSVKRRDWFSFPPDDRLLEGVRPARARRLTDRLTLRSSADRRSSWLEPQIAAASPTVIHAHFGWAAADARLAARRLGVPLVVTFRGADLTIFPGYKRLYRDYHKLFRHVARAICISEFLAARLRAYGYRRPIDIVPTGIRLEDFPFRGAEQPGDSIRILYVGRQVPYKGVDVLLRGLAAAAREEPRLVLDVIGDGPSRPENEGLAQSLGLERRVSFLGAQPRSGVVAALQRANLFVMPSLTISSGQAEGLGNVQKEAMAIGVPVIATRNGGIPETIPPEHRKELVPPGDHDALARTILALARRPEAWPERAGRARVWVESEFSWRQLAQRLTRIYAEVSADGTRA
jgi:colanic acid/amylovoran biosynthesis glycosyltransferase